MGIQSETLRIRPDMFAETFGKGGIATRQVVMLGGEGKLETSDGPNCCHVEHNLPSICPKWKHNREKEGKRWGETDACYHHLRTWYSCASSRTSRGFSSVSQDIPSFTYTGFSCILSPAAKRFPADKLSQRHLAFSLPKCNLITKLSPSLQNCFSSQFLPYN